MKKIVFMTLLMAMLCGPSWAQEGVPPECRILPDHKASADVAYQPGVDVHGKAVVPADLNASPIGAGQTIAVPLSVDLAQRLQNQNIQGLRMEGTLGFLEIESNGRVTYNGQDLTSQVHVLCDKQLTAPPAPDGQTPPDAVEYAPVQEHKPAPKAPPKPVTPPAPEEKPTQAAPPKAEEPQGELLQGGDYAE